MPAYQAPQIDSSSSIDSNLSNEAERRGWNKASYNRKNQEPVNFYDFTRKNLNFEIKRGEPIKDKDGKAVRDKAGRIIFNRPSIIPLGSQPLSLKERYEKRLDEIGYKPWQNANNNQPNTNVRIVLSGDHDRMSEIAFGKPTDFEKGTDNSHAQLVKIEPDKLREMAERYGVQDLIDTEQEYSQIALYALCFYKFLCNKFGEENVIGLCCHLDETTPHFHAWVVPVAEKMKSGRTGGYTLVDETGKPVLDENGNETHITTRAFERMPEEKRSNYVKTTASKKMGLSYASYFGKSRSEAVTSYEKYHDMIHEEVTKKWGFDRGEILRNMTPEERAKHGRKSKKQLERERLLEEKKLQEVMEKKAKAERNLMEMEIKKEKLTTENNQLREENSQLRDKLLNGRNALEKFKNLKDKTEIRWLAQRSILSFFDKAYTGVTTTIFEALNMIDKVEEKLGVEREYWTMERYKGKLEDFPSWTDKLLDEVVTIYNNNISNSTGGGRWDSPVGISNTGGVGTVGSPLKRKPDEDDEAFMYRCVAMACMKAKKSKGLKR